MKFMLVLLCSLTLSFTASAIYDIIPLRTEIDLSQNCVVGEIVKLDEDFVWLNVKQRIFGEIKSGTIAVRRFYNWTCASRSVEYRVGQKEVIFFSKTNNLINEFEYIGIGAGDEFELPLLDESTVSLAHFAYGGHGQGTLKLADLIGGITDYRRFLHIAPDLYIEELELQLHMFLQKSPVHEILFSRFNMVENDSNKISYSYDEVSSILDTTSKVLYKGIYNIIRLDITKADNLRYFLTADNATVRKLPDAGYYGVKPTTKATSVTVAIRKTAGLGDTTIAFTKPFVVENIPDPTIYIRETANDTQSVNSFGSEIPLRLYHKLGPRRQNRHLIYTILAFDVDFMIAGKRSTVKCKSTLSTLQYRNLAISLKPGDSVRFYNIRAAYPDNSVKVVAEKTFYLK